MNGGVQSPRRIGRRLHRRAAGFTIVETLIVLAVTMAIFASAILLVNGKQHVAEFNQSIRAFQTDMQQTVNQVASGYTATATGTTCNTALVFGTGGSDTQGSNQSCIFLGKIIQFGSSAATPQQYKTYPLAGLNSGLYGGTYKLSATTSKVVTDATATTVGNLQYGLTVSTNATTGGVYYGAHQTIGAFGFATNLTALANGDGSQPVSLLAVPGTSIGSDTALIDSRIKTAVVDPSGGVRICLNSGGTDQSGLITIGGGSNGSASVDLRIYGHKDCV